MKAGIYKTPNGNYVYVAKDRTIMAASLEPSSWVGNKVRTSEREQKVHFFDVTAKRVADVPNGTTDHAAALTAYVERHGVVRDAETGMVLGVLSEPIILKTSEAGKRAREFVETPQVVVDIESRHSGFDKHTTVGKSERLAGMPPALGMPYGTGSAAAALFQASNFIREADVGVPAHVAHKMVDAYREKYPHLANFLADPAVVIAGATAAGARGAKSLVDVDFREAELRVAAAMPEGMNFIPATGSVDALPHVNGRRFFVRGEESDSCAAPRTSFNTFLSNEHDNDGKPFDTASVRKTLDTIVDYERAKKDLQVLLHLEQTGVVQWAENDWDIWDLEAYSETMANPPKVLPVLPRGYMEERADAYVRNKPFVSSAKSDDSVYTKDYSQAQRASVSAEIEQLQRQMLASAREAHEQMAKAFFAEALGIAEVVQDEVIVLDCARWNSLEVDIREGRYEVERSCATMSIRDVSTGVYHPVSPYKAEFIAASNGFRVGGTMEEPAILRTKSLTVCVTGSLMPAAAKRHGATGAIATSEDEHEQLMRLASGEIRLIGKQSKRKHRRAGHRVFWCAPLNSWAWEVRS